MKTNNIVYIKDTDENRNLLVNKLGKPNFIWNYYSYIEINLNENSWRTCFDHEWLYRDQPQLITIDELFDNISKIELLNDELINKAIQHVKKSYCEQHVNMPYMLLGDVAELIKILTGKEIDHEILISNKCLSNNKNKSSYGGKCYL